MAKRSSSPSVTSGRSSSASRANARSGTRRTARNERSRSRCSSTRCCVGSRWSSQCQMTRPAVSGLSFAGFFASFLSAGGASVVSAVVSSSLFCVARILLVFRRARVFLAPPRAGADRTRWPSGPPASTAARWDGCPSRRGRSAPTPDPSAPRAARRRRTRRSPTACRGPASRRRRDDLRGRRARRRARASAGRE